MEEDRHVIEICHAANGFSPVAVYAHCVCGWKSGRCQLTGTKIEGRDVAVVVAEAEGDLHVEQAYSIGF